MFNGSNFNESFYLAQFHFHWGENDYQGIDYSIKKINDLKVTFY